MCEQTHPNLTILINKAYVLELLVPIWSTISTLFVPLGINKLHRIGIVDILENEMSQFLEMKIFVKIVEAGTITKAADQLGIAKSAISSRVEHPNDLRRLIAYDSICLFIP